MPDMPLIDIRPDHWRIVRDILQKHVPHYQVWAFGSRTKWTAKAYSDLDLAIITEKPLSLKTITNLSEDLSESDLPWRVDIVDWSTTSASFQKVIERDKVILQTADRINDSANRDDEEVEQGDKDVVRGSRATGRGLEGRIDWSIVKLGDFCTKIGSGATPKGGASVYMDEGEICLIRSQNIYNEGFNPSGLVYINEEAAKKLKSVTVEKNDVLLNITGDSVARVCLAKSEYLPARVNQHVTIIRPKEQEFDPRFIRYLLASPVYQNLLLSIAAVGATRNALTKGIIETLEVVKPPIEQQIEIANKLESLDNKIELNTQTNQTLEQIAQALFKSWFVDFDPVKAKIEVLSAGGSAEDAELAAMRIIAAKSPDELTELKQTKPETFEKLAQTTALFPSAMQESELGEIPEGWVVELLKNCTTELRRGISPKYTEENGVLVINQKCIRNHTVNFSLARLNDSGKRKVAGREIEIGDVLVNSTGVGTLGRLAPVRYLPETCVVDSHVTVVRANASIISKSFLAGLMIANEPMIEASGAGSTGQTELRKQVLEDIQFALPPIELTNEFEIISNSVNLQIANSEKQEAVLSSLRDSLLPKLILGELEV